MGKTTKKIINPEDGFVKLTSGEDMGNIHHIRGGSLNITQSDTDPEEGAPEMAVVSAESRGFIYFGLGDESEYIYGKAINSQVTVSVTSVVKD